MRTKAPALKFHVGIREYSRQSFQIQLSKFKFTTAGPVQSTFHSEIVCPPQNDYQESSLTLDLIRIRA